MIGDFTISCILLGDLMLTGLHLYMAVMLEGQVVEATAWCATPHQLTHICNLLNTIVMDAESHFSCHVFSKTIIATNMISL